MSMSVCLSSRKQNSGTTHPIFIKFSRMLPVAVARSSSCGLAICCVFPVLWMPSYLHVSQGCSTSPPSWSAASAHVCSLGPGYKRCAVIPVAGQRTHGPTFCALKVTSQVAAPGSDSAVHNCLVYTWSGLISQTSWLIRTVYSYVERVWHSMYPPSGVRSSVRPSVPAWATSCATDGMRYRSIAARRTAARRAGSATLSAYVVEVAGHKLVTHNLCAYKTW